MFDVDHISHILKEARIRKNLTQSALADRLGITYQAVSNWERGASLPDLAKLSGLCELLEIDLYELIGASQSQDLAEAMLSDPKALQNASMKAITAVAPMLPPEQLIEAVQARKSDIRDLATLTQLAPYIDEALTAEIGANLVPDSVGELLSLSPFVPGEQCAKWMEALEHNRDFALDVGLLSALGPYLSTETMDRLSERVVPDTLVILSSVAPFLSTDALCRLANKLERITLDDYLIGLECLQPFLGLEAMERLHKKVVVAE